jgi:hypothetical protein
MEELIGFWEIADRGVLDTEIEIIIFDCCR